VALLWKMICSLGDPTSLRHADFWENESFCILQSIHLNSKPTLENIYLGVSRITLRPSPTPCLLQCVRGALQCAAVCGIVLQRQLLRVPCITLRPSHTPCLLQCVRGVLQCAAVCCSVLHCVADPVPSSTPTPSPTPRFWQVHLLHASRHVPNFTWQCWHELRHRRRRRWLCIRAYSNVNASQCIHYMHVTNSIGVASYDNMSPTRRARTPPAPAMAVCSHVFKCQPRTQRVYSPCTRHELNGCGLYVNDTNSTIVFIHNEPSVRDTGPSSGAACVRVARAGAQRRGSGAPSQDRPCWK